MLLTKDMWYYKYNYSGQRTLYYPTPNGSSQECEDFPIMSHNESEHNSEIEDYNTP